jgi:hypothetical protein
MELLKMNVDEGMSSRRPLDTVMQSKAHAHTPLTPPRLTLSFCFPICLFIYLFRDEHVKSGVWGTRNKKIFSCFVLTEIFEINLHV